MTGFGDAVFDTTCRSACATDATTVTPAQSLPLAESVGPLAAWLWSAICSVLAPVPLEAMSTRSVYPAELAV